MRRRIEAQWHVGFTRNPAIAPEHRVPARVPGAVQLDWAWAEGRGDHWYAENFRQYAWMEDVHWSYVTRVPDVTPSSGERLFFVCGGVDYACEIRSAAGRMLHRQEGMFTPIDVDLTGVVAAGEDIEVLVAPAPKREGASVGREQADQSCKPAVSYGWDWHPRLIPLGIWEETYFEIRPGTYLRHAEVRYVLAEDLGSAELTLSADIDGTAPARLRWTVYDPAGRRVHAGEGPATETRVTLRTPELWWPHDQGRPALYRSTVELLNESGAVMDARTFRFGLRRVELVMAPGQWSEPRGFPKSRSHPPMTLRVNGREIFCRGSNWVNPEIFPGTVTADTYRPLLQLAKDANFNLLRAWGGGIVNKEPFFELCDELGILVWQEFPLACNNYAGTPSYLAVLDRESQSIIRRVRRHPCLAIWCGGNELFNSWSKMTDQSLALRLLNRNCFDLDPHTPFLPTSPIDGIGHGGYLFHAPWGEEVYASFNKARFTAYTEFGVPGPSPVEVLKTFIPAQELWPPTPGGSWEAHHAFGAWDVDPKTWLCPDVIERYFGPSQSLEQLVARGEWLQCEGYKHVFEEARRQKPRCSMALNWCYNEPWPTAANNSLINWPARPKPAYRAVAASCRPVLASARVQKFSWAAGEQLAAELFVLNDSPAALEGGVVEATLEAGAERVLLATWEVPASVANTNVAGPIVRVTLPRWEADRMTLRLRYAGHPERDSSYVLPYRPR